MNQMVFDEIKTALREHIVAEFAQRKNPCSWRACHPDPETPEGIEYARVCAEHYKATAKLWMATDVEYEPSEPLYTAAWNWRYWVGSHLPDSGFLHRRTIPWSQSEVICWIRLATT